jgi:hypothetical protein
MNCPYCGSKKTTKRGQKPKQRWQCTDPRHPDGVRRYFYGEAPPAKILLFDIETLPMQFYGWKLWDKITSPDFIIRDWVVLSYAAKWLFEPSSMSAALTPKEALAYDDRRLVGKIHDLFEQADVIIAHNGDMFDMPRMNTRFLLHDMNPPSPYQTIDTCETAKKAFNFSSNKLDYLGQYLGIGRKHETDFDLWKRCVAGEKAALAQMLAYNEQDIYLLEDVYVKLRPWIRHPNMNMFSTAEPDALACGRCGSDDLDLVGVYPTKKGTASVHETYQCNNCHGWVRSGKSKRTYKARVV